jgi:glutathione peroxidase
MKLMFTAVAVLICAGLLMAADTAAPTTPVSGDSVPPVLNFKMKRLNGADQDLAAYKGKVILMVNVASKCGNTPQYAPLEALYEKYGPKGFVILGFPANNFGHQEPGTDVEISEFCTKNYGVKFDMFSKVDVLDPAEQCPLYKYLTSPETDPKFSGKITWNFEKFLISKDGKIVNRFAPKTQPDSDEVVAAIESEIAK